MKWLIIGIIRLYWLLAPRSIRARCLFDETCSHHVMRYAKEKGAAAALAAFFTRFRQCRPGYRLLNVEGLDCESLVTLADGTTVPFQVLSMRVVQSLIRP